MNQFTPHPRVFRLDRFKFFRKFAEIFASQGAPPVSTTPVTNLPPISATPAANFYTIFASVVDQRHRRQICHRCRWHRWQIMATISGYRHLLKGQCHEIFCFLFFCMNQFPPSPSVLNFFENSRRYSQAKVHHRYQRHQWQICHCTGVNDTGSKFCYHFPLCCWYRWQICHRYQRRRRQIWHGGK